MSDQINQTIQQMTAASLSERAMLVQLNTSFWTPPRIDRALSDETAKQHGIPAHLVKTHKFLIDPKTPSYAALLTAKGKLRNDHYRMTLPWSDDQGKPRILPAVSFPKYAEVMRQDMASFNDCRDTFCGEWPALIQRAIADMHGIVTLSDFPADIRGLISVRHSVTPIPSMPHDIRVNMSDHQAAALRDEMTRCLDQQIRDALVVATREPYKRMFVHLTRMVERLNGVKQNGNASDFRPTLITGLRDICAALPALNVCNDPTLAEIGMACDAMVANISAEQLASVPVIRQRVACEAAALLDRIAPQLATDQQLSPEADAVMQQAGAAEAAMRGFQCDF